MLDVVLITKNAADHSTVFEKALDILYREIPVARLIVVDGFSTDRTLAVLKQYPRVELHQVKGNRADARQYGVEQVETEWLLFLDDDVLLCRNWFAKASKYMDDDQVGLIWGWDRIAYPPSRNRMKVMYYLRRKSEYELMKKNFQHRGGTHDTLIRTQAIKGIQIPSDLHVYEDWYIKDHIEKKGFRTIAPRDLWCYHIFKPSYTLENCSLIAKLHEKYGLQSSLVTLRNFLLAVPKSLAVLSISGDTQASIDQFKLYSYVFLGRFFLNKQDKPGEELIPEHHAVACSTQVV